METFCRDPSRALNATRIVALLIGLLLPAEVLRAQEVDKDGLYSQPFLVLDPEMHADAITATAVDAGGRYIVTGSYDKTVRVWSGNDGRLLRTIRMPSGPEYAGQVNTVALSPDGNTIAAAGGSPHIFLFDRATGRQVLRMGLPTNDSIINKLALSHDGRRIAAGIQNPFSLRLFDLDGPNEIAFDDEYKESIYGISFDAAGRIATASEDHKLRLYDRHLKLIRSARAPGRPPLQPFQIAFSPDGKRLAVGYGPETSTPRVDVVDGRTLAAIFVPPMKGYSSGRLTRIAWSKDGSILYAGGTTTSRDGVSKLVFAWKNGGRGPAQVFPAGSETISEIRELSGGRIVVASMRPSLSIFDRGGTVLRQIDPTTGDFRQQAKALKVSPDGNTVLFNFAGADDKSIAAFDISRRALDIAPNPRSGLVAPRIEGLPITDWENKTNPKLGGRPLTDDNFTSRSLAIARDASSFWLARDWDLRHLDADGNLIRQINAVTIPWAVNLAADDRLVIAAHGDGTIRWYRSADGVEILTFYPHADRKRWVAWTPLGHYAASPGAEDFIQWQVNRGLDQEPITYSASRFRDQFYRPDVIERVLETLDPKAALEAADAAAGRTRSIVKSITEYTPPRVAIVDPADATFVQRPELVVAYTIEDRPGTAIRRIRLMLDGSVVAEEKNRTVAQDGRMAGEFKVSLQSDQSLVTLILLAENEHGTSDPSSVRLRRNVTTDDHKPTLYVLAVGVGEFKNHPHLKLNFAHADANAFVERVVRQEHGLYSRVLAQTLVNEQATAEAILKGLEWLERSMSSRDVAAVFFSSHGANDTNRQFYLLPHDVNVLDEITLRRSALKYVDLRDTLVRLAERGKTLLFLDACYSGNVLPGAKQVAPPDIDMVAADLASTEGGVVVFSSSTGKQFSMEYPELGHGAFTAALLEAFDGKSDRPPPWLRVSDLEIWLTTRVKELTKGAQTPRTTVPGERFINPRVFMMQHQTR